MSVQDTTSGKAEESPTAPPLARESRSQTGALADGYQTNRCPACVGISVLQEKWVLHIVNALLDGPKGFNAIGREVGGCNPTTLTQRLGRLEQLGLVVKDHGAGQCRAFYRLTESGERLEGVIEAIRHWADAHLVGNGEAHH